MAPKNSGHSSGGNLRRSCHFCRTRKIRCSEQSSGICTACKERGIDCVYDTEAAKGRPKGTTNKNSQKSASSGRQNSNTPPYQDSFSTWDSSNPAHSADGFPTAHLPPEYYDRQQVGWISRGSIGEDLEIMFSEAFGEDPASTEPNTFQRSIAAFNRRLDDDTSTTIRSLGFPESQAADAPIPYDGLFGFMSQELVEMLSARFGHLGCCNNDDPRSGFFVTSLAKDDTPRMFTADTPIDSNPINELDDQVRLQLIEMWFNIHPLSMLLSKTLFLRSYKSNDYDEALLAAILADAYHFHTGGQSSDLEERLFRRVDKCLRDRPNDSWDLATAQVLMLVGWHELCLRHARRATCFIGYGGRLSTQFQSDQAAGKRSGRSRVNGIEIESVEMELIQNLYWLTFSTTLWAFMEMGEPFSMLLPKSLPHEFPPVDETHSAIIKLDMASDIVSTFQSQARMIRGLWPLAHIASTVAHIYALYPHDPEGPYPTVSWQFRPLHQLRRLLSIQEDFGSLCGKVQKVLTDAIQTIQTEIRNEASKALVTVAYHILIVHLQFPRQSVLEDSVTIVTPHLVDEFVRSGTNLLRLISRISTSKTTSRLVTIANTSSPMINLADIFTLGLDVCGRALMHLYSRAHSGSKAEHDAVLPYVAELRALATQLHAVAKEDLIRSTTRSRMAKRTLKAAKLRFVNFGSAVSLDSENMMYSAASSVRHTPSSSVQLNGSPFPVPPVDGIQKGISPQTTQAMRSSPPNRMIPISDVPGLGVLDPFPSRSLVSDSPFPSDLGQNGMNQDVHNGLRRSSNVSSLGLEPEIARTSAVNPSAYQPMGLDAWGGDPTFGGLHQMRLHGASDGMWHPDESQSHSPSRQRTVPHTTASIPVPNYQPALSVDGLNNFFFNGCMASYGANSQLGYPPHTAAAAPSMSSSVPSLGSGASPSDMTGIISTSVSDLGGDSLLVLSVSDPTDPGYTTMGVTSAPMYAIAPPSAKEASMILSKEFDVMPFNGLNPRKMDQDPRHGDVEMSYGFT